MSAQTFIIDHQIEANRFVIATADDAAVLEYKTLDSNVVDFTRTYVPTSQRGQGHAPALVQAGLAWANQQGYTIKASCWYVDKFLTTASQ